MIDDEDDDETEQEQNKIGSFFAKRQAEKNYIQIIVMNLQPMTNPN